MSQRHVAQFVLLCVENNDRRSEIGNIVTKLLAGLLWLIAVKVIVSGPIFITH